MKKILALVLVLMMVLCSVSALAGGSKKTSDMNNATTGQTGANAPKLTKIGDTPATTAIKQAVKDAQAAGDVTKAFPADIAATIPEDQRTVNEMDTYKLDGDVTGLQTLTLIFKFATPYAEGQKVTVMFAIAKSDTETEWLKKEGTGNKDGTVSVVVTAADLAKISNYPFVVIPVSK